MNTKPHEYNLNLFTMNKKSILALTVATLISGAIVTSCNSVAEKVENAQDGVKEAHDDLDKANQEYLEDVLNYRKEAANKISTNEQSIVQFKSRIELEKKEAKDDYKKKIAVLEQKNSDMKKRMDDYKVEGKEKWKIFKTEFSRDMDELGNAFKDLTVKNVKK